MIHLTLRSFERRCVVTTPTHSRPGALDAGYDPPTPTCPREIDEADGDPVETVDERAIATRRVRLGCGAIVIQSFQNKWRHVSMLSPQSDIFAIELSATTDAKTEGCAGFAKYAVVVLLIGRRHFIDPPVTRAPLP